ncbi:MAG TPA: hypothetical protein DCX46_08040 [Bacteroidetes bacterium]|nr:MAG: hypothetical protein A2X68_11520 [Ignavibacteria bacterium GWC2_56_12]HAV23431.1 hypothetical protein [Bacteroidota bacterium]
MKNKSGIFRGFIVGMIGFLLMFKLIILDRIPPSDELAPGIVVFASMMNGVLCAFVGNLIQNRLRKRTTTTEST